MKIFKSMIGLLLLFVSGCASTPERTTIIDTNDRDEFAKIVSNRLDAYEKTARDLKGPKQRELRAAVNDTRAELRVLEQQPRSSWQQYRTGVESRLQNLRRLDEMKGE